MTEDIDWVAIGRYLTGESSGEERARIERWIAGDPGRGAMIEAMKAAWQDAAALPTAGDLESGWRAVSAHMRAGGRAAKGAPKDRRVIRLVGAESERAAHGGRRSAVWWAARIAASIVIVVGGTLIWRSGWFGVGMSGPFREFASPAGSRTTITLRDGSRFLLGPATRLRVPADFGRVARNVELDGEALFTVVHDARRPFAVRTAHTIVRDIGTTFVVRAYGDDAVERVAVAEGEVAIAGVTLRVRDGASVDTAGRVTVRHEVAIASDMAWVQGGLAFKDTPLREVARELARAYDVDVTIVDSSLAGKPITASFNGEPIDDVLRAVTFTAGGHYERVGRSVVIRPGLAPASQRGRAIEPPVRITNGTSVAHTTTGAR